MSEEGEKEGEGEIEARHDVDEARGDGKRKSS